MSKRKHWFSLIFGMGWVFLCLILVTFALRNLPSSFPSPLRLTLKILAYWLIVAVPLVSSIKNRDRFWESKTLLLQLAWGLVIGGGISLLLTLVPHLLGWGQYVGGSKHSTPKELVLLAVFYLAAVGTVEEFIFRGFLVKRLEKFITSQWAVIGISSLLFGLSHIMSGDVLQILITSLIGAFYCLCQRKLPHCSLLSLVIAHALYDWLIDLWATIFAA